MKLRQIKIYKSEQKNINHNKIYFSYIKACKYLTNEIAESLLKHDSSENIETGYNLDERLDKKEKTKYKDS